MTDTSRAADLWLEASGRPRLRYRDAGRGPAVLLVHGWPLDLTMYDELTAILSRSFRVVRWDRRGFGESAGTPSLSEDAADALRLLDRLGIGRTALLGTSQGCRVALAVAEEVRERIDALVLDGAPALDGLPGRHWQNETPVYEYRERLLERGIDALRADLVRHPLLQPWTPDPALYRRMADMLQRYRGADLLALPQVPPPVAASPDTGRFTRLRMPVLVLNGEHDTPQRREVGAALAAAIPGAIHRAVPDSGHLACWDNPAGYGALVHEFLTRALSGAHR